MKIEKKDEMVERKRQTHMDDEIGLRGFFVHRLMFLSQLIAILLERV